jgi:L-cysteine:1D-myo-inositol 2-amino-2-deoxy-alpha-D-glucopyranoside ligase
MIGLDGQKMSKSRGNLVLVSQLLADGVDPMAIRLGLLGGHYRTDRDWTDEVLKTAQQRLATWRAAAGAAAGPDGASVLSALRGALCDDLDTPTALRAVDEWSDSALAGTGADTAAPELVSASVDALLGVRL